MNPAKNPNVNPAMNPAMTPTTGRETIATIFTTWTGSVAGAIIAGLDRVASPRGGRLIEDEKGGFAVGAPPKAETAPGRLRFVNGAFSPAQLPRGAPGSRVWIG